MKTPREILLRRHELATRELDKRRAEALSAMRSSPSNATRHEVDQELSLPLRALRAVWRELIWPCRKTWAGIAAVWLVIISINFLILDTPGATRGGGGIDTTDIRTLIAEQARLIAELGETVPSSPPPQPAASRPRSQNRVTNRAHC
jgi:hypothetical protein